MRAAMNAEINPAAQIEPDRHVCAQPQPDGFLELMQHLGRVSILIIDGAVRNAFGSLGGDLVRPIAADLGLAGLKVDYTI